MSFNSFNVWQCLLRWCLTGTLAGCNALGLPSFPFELHVLALLWHWEWPWRSLRAARPSPSSVVICFLYLDSWGNVTSLLKLNYLIRTYHVLNIPNELKRFFFFFLEHYVLWIQFFLHFIQWSYYIIQYFSIQYFFHFIFWFLYIKDTNYRLIGFSLLLFDFFICVVCNYLVFSSLPVIWFSYVRSLMILIKLFIFKYCLFGPQFISFSLRTPFPSHSVILSPLSSFYNESFKDTEKLKEFIVATYIPILQIL